MGNGPLCWGTGQVCWFVTQLLCNQSPERILMHILIMKMSVLRCSVDWPKKDELCFDRLKAMTQATMCWHALVGQEASMHAPLPNHLEWGLCLYTSMLEFCLHMAWLLLTLCTKHRNHVLRSMNQVK
jgi:hypothetical protein